MESSKVEFPTFKVLIFPWLAHGHIFPYFELAKKLAKKNFHIFFCSTAINLASIKKTFNQSETISSMEFIELHLPDLPELSSHYHTTKGLPPNLRSTLLLAFEDSQTSFSEIIANLKPDLLIYDAFQSWAVEIASAHKIPSVHLYTSGAASLSYFRHVHKYGLSQADHKYPFPEIYFRQFEFKRLVAMAKSNPQLEKTSTSPIVSTLELSHEIVLIKSSREIEQKYLDYVSTLCGKKMVPLGPFVHETPEIEENQDLHIFNWLYAKNPNSVVYVSFGSECYPSKEEMEEIAHGLEQSKANFIWVIRFPAGTVGEEVPEGFLERIKDRGIIVEGWAPQAKILKHPSIGGFMSHCGWGSITESLYYGVPLITMGMQYDQHTNGRFAVGIGIGIEVLRGENGELRREEITKVIQEIVEKESGKLLKKKARELSEKLRMEEDQLINEAIEELRKIFLIFPWLAHGHHTTKGLPPNLHSTLRLAFEDSQTSFSEIIANLKPDLLIYDGFQPWAVEIASAHKIPSVHFYTSGAGSMSYFQHIYKYGLSQPDHKYPFPEIYFRQFEFKSLVAMAKSNPQLAKSSTSPLVSTRGLSHEIVLIKSSKELEGKYLDYLSTLCGKKMVPLGPFVHEHPEIEENQDLRIFNWLNSKNPNSVVYVSFGSECYPSEEEMDEIAYGLEHSRANFIWIIRFPAGSTGRVAETIPEGFLERIKDRGLIVEAWAPQAKILGHPSIGGFMSHCGWNSPTNGRLVVGIGVGMEVMRAENGELKREEIAKVIDEIVVKKSGENLKRKARELSKKLRTEEEELIDEAIEELSKICSKKIQQQSAP
ncbi:hypothetical protein M9H77_36807 [Catharanthus roseus]|uniref:Uncharacterized protein n=1 Tax=Catharanthus roseus TaxID=4058 RepID=A0ACB9ZV24_CATRO|nr:hypothetical protein M9H77_36807 [Catharanthus roseus]